MALLIAQLISTRLRWPALVVDSDFTAGTAREHIPSDGQSHATLVDALEAIREGRVRGPTDLAPYVCVIPGGAHLLAAPKDPEQLSAIDEEGMREMLEALRVLYPVTIMDCAPGIGLRDRTQKLTHEIASDLLAVVLPRRVDAEQARWTLGYVALQYRAPLTVVINRMPRRLDEGARSAQQVPVGGERTIARMELPHDEELQRQLDAAVLDVDQLHQATRIAVKQLVISLSERPFGAFQLLCQRCSARTRCTAVEITYVRPSRCRNQLTPWMSSSWAQMVIAR